MEWNANNVCVYLCLCLYVYLPPIRKSLTYYALRWLLIFRILWRCHQFQLLNCFAWNRNHLLYTYNVIGVLSSFFIYASLCRFSSHQWINILEKCFVLHYFYFSHCVSAILSNWLQVKCERISIIKLQRNKFEAGHRKSIFGKLSATSRLFGVVWRMVFHRKWAMTSEESYENSEKWRCRLRLS